MADLAAVAYQCLHTVGAPIHRSIRRRRAMLYGLGAGRPRRIGRCLFSFITDYPSYIRALGAGDAWDSGSIGEVIDREAVGRFAQHQLHWESAEIVRQLIERGYVVDCIYDRNGGLVDNVGGYDLILDEWSNLPRWSAANPDAVTWSYATTAHWLTSNTATLERLKWLFARRGVADAPGFLLPPLLGPEVATMVTYKGSSHTLSTYGLYRSKMRPLRSSSVAQPLAFPVRDWARARRHFLYFGSSGWVHRGLDLILEAFLGTGLDLSVCGRYDGVESVYQREIAAASNVRFEGFVDPMSEAFIRLVGSAGAIVYPSCSEGCSGGVVLAMQYGLVPLITEACGVGVEHLVPPVTGATDQEIIGCIRERAVDFSTRSCADLTDTSKALYEFARTNHSRVGFRAGLEQFLDELLA